MPPEATAASTARIVIVAPPSSWRDDAVDELTRAWYLVTTIDDGRDIVGAGDVPRADLAVVDLGLRDPSGVEICASLRARSAVVLLAVGIVAAEDEIVAACESGADGCLVSPMSSRILLARVAGLLRRIPAPVRQWANEPLCCGELSLDPDSGTVTVHGLLVSFRTGELELLEVLLTNSHRVVRRGELLAALSATGVSDADLDGYLRRLRERIEELDAGCAIRTIRKVGVRLVTSDDAAGLSLDLESVGPTDWA